MHLLSRPTDVGEVSVDEHCHAQHGEYHAGARRDDADVVEGVAAGQGQALHHGLGDVHGEGTLSWRQRRYWCQG